MKKVLFVLFVAAMAVACKQQAPDAAAPAEATTPTEAPAAPAEAPAAPADTTATAPAAH